MSDKKCSLKVEYALRHLYAQCACGKWSYSIHNVGFSGLNATALVQAYKRHAPKQVTFPTAPAPPPLVMVASEDMPWSDADRAASRKMATQAGVCVCGEDDQCPMHALVGHGPLC